MDLDSPLSTIADVEAQLGPAFTPVLEINLILADAVPFLKADDYDGFLRVRGEYLATQIGCRLDPSKAD